MEEKELTIEDLKAKIESLTKDVETYKALYHALLEEKNKLDDKLSMVKAILKVL